MRPIDQTEVMPIGEAGDLRAALDRVFAIANERSLPATFVSPDIRQSWEAAGFLASAYSREKYERLARNRRIFVARKRGGMIAAFSVVYKPDDPIDDGDFGSEFIRQQFGAVPIIKQIVTDSKFENLGFSKALNDDLSARFPSLPVYAAIVEEPRNLRSEGFHRKVGYERQIGFDHPDGRPRGIWMRPPQNSATALAGDEN